MLLVFKVTPRWRTSYLCKLGMGVNQGGCLGPGQFAVNDQRKRSLYWCYPTCKMDRENFNFDAWTLENRLSRESCNALKTLQLTDYDCLMAIKSGEMKRAGLQLGQEIYFRMGLAKLGNPNFQESQDQVTAAPTPRASTQEENRAEALTGEDRGSQEETGDGDGSNSVADDLLDAGAKLDALLKGSSDVNGLLAAQKPTPVISTYDPRILLTAKSAQKKAEKIVNFLPEKVKERIQKSRRERMILTHQQDGTISIKNNDQEFYSISMSEWGAANMRLMSYLLETGALHRDHVEYYLSYTMQVFELADIYEWSSVLHFDTRYRDLQAEHGFVWGDMRLSMQMQLLVPKSVQHGKPRPNKYPARPEEDCKKWLATGGHCPFGTKCKYVHRKLDIPTTTVAKND